jgi:hypothetical protein
MTKNKNKIKKKTKNNQSTTSMNAVQSNTSNTSKINAKDTDRKPISHAGKFESTIQKQQTDIQIDQTSKCIEFDDSYEKKLAMFCVASPEEHRRYQRCLRGEPDDKWYAMKVYHYSTFLESLKD